MLWVILGYALGTSIGISIVPFIRVFKIVFVIGSLIFVLYKNGISTFFLINNLSLYLIIFFVSFLSFFADEPFKALYKSLTFVYPFLYLVFSVNYLLRYGVINFLIGVSFAVLLVYALVPLSFYLIGGNLDDNIVYGYTEGNFFVSNHYGWGSTLFILSSLTIVRFYPLKTLHKIVIYIFLPLALYLLIISANRAGILSVFIAFVLFFIMDRQSSFTTKFILFFGALMVFFIVGIQEDSAIDFIIQKNESQLESGIEGRLIGTNAMIRSFENNPTYWFTGVGMFNYTELKLNGGVLGVYHNSYWEILFGSGIIVFAIFLNYVVFRPVIVFWKISGAYSLLLIPLIIIPFFESNLTAGQFLFFPWFIYMILLNAKEFTFMENQKKEIK